MPNPQNYPRMDGYLDITMLKEHINQLSDDEIKTTVKNAIHYANRKSSREILNIPNDATDEETLACMKKSGCSLFDYFIKYCGDPAATSHQCYNRHYSEVAKDQFRNRTLQKERMNSGWRYQYIAKNGAEKSGRFRSVSDIGLQEADFNAVIAYTNVPKFLTLYVSVKNRTNTMGGQDWPKAIHALEMVANQDRNREGDYLCVFGIAMEKGQRLIKRNGRTKQPFSVNTEVWKSSFFWPFFTNLSYEQVMNLVLDVLLQDAWPAEDDVDIPEELIESFGNCCRNKSLIGEDGRFNDPYKLVRIFCGEQQ